MATTELAPMRKRRFYAPARPVHASVSAALALLSGSSHAAEWTIVPSVGLRETYSDNIALAPASSAKSEWVTEVVPGIAAQAIGPRFRMNAIYTMHLLDYRNGTPAPRTLHEGNLTANGEVVKDLFFVDAAASATQQNILSFAPQGIDLANTTGNRTEVRTASVSPYLRRTFGNVATAELRYTEQRLRTADVEALDADSTQTLFVASSGPRFNAWGWELMLDRQRIDYVNAFPVEFNRYTGKLRYAVSPRLLAHIVAGHEDNNYPTVGSDRNGRVWALGLSWAPSAVTSIAASAGHRYFGRTYSALARYRTPTTNWTVGYNEDVTTLAGIGSTGTFSTVNLLNALSGTASSGSATAPASIIWPGTAPGNVVLPENKSGSESPNPFPDLPLANATGAEKKTDPDKADTVPRSGNASPAAQLPTPQPPAAPPAAVTMNPLADVSIAGTPVQHEILDPFALNAGLPANLSGSIYGLSNRVYLQKLLQASLELTGARNKVLLRLYGTRRRPLSDEVTPVVVPATPFSIPDEKVREVGIGALWTLNLTPRTSFNVDASAARIRSEIDDRKDHDKSLRIYLVRKLQEKMSGAIEMRRQERSSNASNGDYRENALVFSFLMQF